MSEFLFNVAAVICSIVVTFWLLDRIEHAWHAISGQRDREAQLLDRYASSVYLAHGNSAHARTFGARR